MISNSWDFAAPQACSLSNSITNVGNLYLTDKATGIPQGPLDITNPNLQISTGPSFTLKFTATQQGCSILRVPIVIFPSSSPASDQYSRTPNNYLTKQSDGSFTQDFTLTPGTYVLNAGIETNSGTLWGLSAIKMSFISGAIVNIQGTSGTGSIWDWFTPIRDFGILLSLVGLGTVIYAMPTKRW